MVDQALTSAFVRHISAESLSAWNAPLGYGILIVIGVAFILYRYVLRTPFPPRDLKGRPIPWIHPGLLTKFGDVWTAMRDPLGDAERFAKRQNETGDLVYLGGELSGVGGRPSFVVFGRDNIRKLLGHSVSIKNSIRNIGGIFPIWDKMFGKGLFMISGEEWKRTHKIALRAMGSIHRASFFPHVMSESLRVLSDFNSMVEDGFGKAADYGQPVLHDAVQDAFKRNREARAPEGAPLPLLAGHLFGALSLRVICSVSFGSQVDAQFINTKLKIMLGQEGVDGTKTNPIWSILDMIPGFLDLPLEFNRSRLSAISDLHNYCRSYIKNSSNEEGDDGKKNLLNLLVDASHPEEGKLSEREVLDNVFAFLMAGLTTTQHTMEHIAVQLSLHQEVQNKLRQEIISVTGAEVEPFELDKLAAMPYLSSCVKEVMRLFPSVVGVPPRTLTEDVEIGGVLIPAGSNVNTSSMLGQRLSINFGEDAICFRPERFLAHFSSDGKSAGNKGKRGHGKDHGDNALGYSFTTFGAGVRPCIGRHLSLLEIKTFLILLLKQYRLTPTMTKEEYRKHTLLRGPIFRRDQKTFVGFERLCQM